MTIDAVIGTFVVLLAAVEVWFTRRSNATHEGEPLVAPTLAAA